MSSNTVDSGARSAEVLMTTIACPQLGMGINICIYRSNDHLNPYRKQMEAFLFIRLGKLVTRNAVLRARICRRLTSAVTVRAQEAKQ